MAGEATAAQNIYSSLRYRDAKAAVEWLQEAFGFEERVVYEGDDGTIHHAEMRLGPGLITGAADDEPTGAGALISLMAMPPQPCSAPTG